MGRKRVILTMKRKRMIVELRKDFLKAIGWKKGKQNPLPNNSDYRNSLCSKLRSEDKDVCMGNIIKWLTDHPWISDPIALPKPFKKAGREAEDTSSSTDSSEVTMFTPVVVPVKRSNPSRVCRVTKPLRRSARTTEKNASEEVEVSSRESGESDSEGDIPEEEGDNNPPVLLHERKRIILNVRRDYLQEIGWNVGDPNPLVTTEHHVNYQDALYFGLLQDCDSLDVSYVTRCVSAYPWICDPTSFPKGFRDTSGLSRNRSVPGSSVPTEGVTHPSTSNDDRGDWRPLKKRYRHVVSDQEETSENDRAPTIPPVCNVRDEVAQDEDAAEERPSQLAQNEARTDVHRASSFHDGALTGRSPAALVQDDPMLGVHRPDAMQDEELTSAPHVVNDEMPELHPLVLVQEETVAEVPLSDIVQNEEMEGFPPSGVAQEETVPVLPPAVLTQGETRTEFPPNSVVPDGEMAELLATVNMQDVEISDSLVRAVALGRGDDHSVSNFVSETTTNYLPGMTGQEGAVNGLGGTENNGGFQNAYRVSGVPVQPGAAMRECPPDCPLCISENQNGPLTMEQLLAGSGNVLIGTDGLYYSLAVTPAGSFNPVPGPAAHSSQHQRTASTSRDPRYVISKIINSISPSKKKNRLTWPSSKPWSAIQRNIRVLWGLRFIVERYCANLLNTEEMLHLISKCVRICERVSRRMMIPVTHREAMRKRNLALKEEEKQSQSKRQAPYNPFFSDDPTSTQTAMPPSVISTGSSSEGS